MPLTFPAHQAAVLPLKLWRPRWFDGTALVVGSGAPDLFNAFAFVDTLDSHHWNGVAIAVPFTVVYAILLRRYAVDGLFGSMPDMGRLNVRSYRVLKQGQPRLLVTLLSAFIGVMSHIIVDSFTHSYRIGSNLLGLERTVFTTANGPVSAAKTLQYFGHTFGSLIGIALLAMVVSSKHLGQWYGEDTIAEARRAPVREGAQQRATRIIAVSLAVGAVWGQVVGQFPIFSMGLTLVLGFLIVGIVNRPAAATLQACPDTYIHRTTTLSTASVAHSPKTSRPLATSRHRSFPKAPRPRPHLSSGPAESLPEAPASKRRFAKSTPR